MGTYVTLPGGGGGGGGAETLDDLTDVDTVTDPPDDGDFLVYDSATGEWVPATLVSSGGIPDPGGSNDDLLQRKSGAWTYRTPAQVRTDMKAVQSSDSSVLDIVSITRSAYNALSPPVATTLYVVTP